MRTLWTGRLPGGRATRVCSRRDGATKRVLAEFSDRERYFARPGRSPSNGHHPLRPGTCTSGRHVSFSTRRASPAVATAHLRAWRRAGNPAACVVLAASRDEGYWIREQVFLPLTSRGIDLFLLESPYYGLRRDGRSPSEITVADHGLMALGMVLEARALLDHLKPRYRKLAIAGLQHGRPHGCAHGGRFAASQSRARHWLRERRLAPSTRAGYCRGVWTSKPWAAIRRASGCASCSILPTSRTSVPRYGRTPLWCQAAEEMAMFCIVKPSGCIGIGSTANCAGSRRDTFRR